MRCMHITSGLLSIIGAAFLFGTVQALVTKPVNISAVELANPDAPVKGRESGEDKGETPDNPPPAADHAPTGADELDALLDAPVPDGTLTLRQSHELFDQGAYFVDARHEDDFIAGHIQYAAWLPSTLFDTDSDRAFEVVVSLPKDATIVIYCVGGECDASHNTARRLQQLGFTDLRIMGAGYDDWVAAGFPIEEGSAP